MKIRIIETKDARHRKITLDNVTRVLEDDERKVIYMEELGELVEIVLNLADVIQILD